MSGRRRLAGGIRAEQHHQGRQLYLGVAKRLEPLDADALKHGQELPTEVKALSGSTNDAANTASNNRLRC